MSRALKVKSFVTTPKAVLAEFERRTGPGWTVSYTPLDDLRRLEERLVSENSPAATGVTLRRIWSQGGTLYDKWDNADIGLPEELVKMEDFVVRAVSGELGKHG